MLGVIGVFGDIPFVCSQSLVLTFRDLSRKNSTKWARHEVLGRKPVLEWIGENADEVSFRIRFDQSLNAPPLAGLTALKALMETHEPQILIIGGEYLGKFVIESVDEERRYHSGAGICIVAEADITLTECA